MGGISATKKHRKHKKEKIYRGEIERLGDWEGWEVWKAEDFGLADFVLASNADF
ncbi:MAG: hypothetical protein ACREDR_08895 [Blastocatellia bacterium]